MKTASIFEELEGRTIVGKFALLERLGGSDEACVFLTLRLGGQRALIKLVRAEGAQADACLAQWEAAKGLAHPHLIRVFESGHAAVDAAPLVYVVTENADEVLSTIIRERPLDPLETRDTFGPILDALSYLHATGIVHGHIKPSNASRVGETVKLSADGFLAVPGVPARTFRSSAYDAPELSSGKVTPAADVWSIGMMLCEALTRQLPHLSAEGGLTVPASMPKSFAAIAQECLRFNPDQRCTISDIIPRLAPGLSLPLEFFSKPSQPAPPMPPREEAGSAFTPEELKIVDSLNAPRIPRKASPPPEPDRDVSPAPAPAPPRWQDDAPEPASFNQFSPEPPRRGLSRPAPPPTPSATWQSKWESDTSAESPELFSQYADKEPRRFRVAPFLLGFLVLLGIGAAYLVRSGKIDLAGLEQLAEQKYAALTHSEPAPPPPAQPAATQSAAPQTASVPSAESPDQSQSGLDQPQTAAQSATQQSPASTAAAAPASQPALPSATEPPAAAPTHEPLPSSVSPPTPAPAEPALPANSEGAVAHQVMPGISQAAIESMHGPVRVVIRVEVNKQGDVSDAAYVSPGEGNYFARISRRAAEQWKFQPPRSHGRSETSAWTLHFYFTGSHVDVDAVQGEP
ncbi:MAG: protein kinase [Terracidiphilus sp.]